MVRKVSRVLWCPAGDYSRGAPVSSSEREVYGDRAGGRHPADNRRTAAQRGLWVARRQSKYHQGLLRFSEYPRCEPAMCPAHVILYADKGDAFHLPLIFSPSKILSKSGTERMRIRLGWGRGEGMLQNGWAGEKARRTKCISLRGTSSWLALFSSD